MKPWPSIRLNHAFLYKYLYSSGFSFWLLHPSVVHPSLNPSTTDLNVATSECSIRPPMTANRTRSARHPMTKSVIPLTRTSVTPHMRTSAKLTMNSSARQPTRISAPPIMKRLVRLRYRNTYFGQEITNHAIIEMLLISV